MTVDSRRALCPICHLSIRVVNGRLVDHMVGPPVFFMRKAICAGSGRHAP